MSPLISAHIIIGTICLTLGLVHLFIGLRKSEKGPDLLFAVMALAIAGGMYVDPFLYRAATVEHFNRALRIHVTLDAVLWISMIWFIASYTGTARRLLLLLPTACYAAAGLVNLFSPYGLIYGEITSLETISLAWGEKVVYAAGTPNSWRYFADAGWILLIILSADSCVRLFRRGERRRALTLGSALFLVLIVAYIYGTLMDLGIFGPPNLMGFTFLGLVLIMSSSLNHDVMKASQLSRRVRRNEQRWRNLLENVRLFVLGSDRDGMVNFANPYYLKVTGYSSEEVIGRHFTEFLPERDRGKMEDAYRSALQSGPQPSLQLSILTKWGKERQVLMSSVFLYDQHGGVEGTMSVGADITERLEAEESRDKVIAELEALKTQLEEENIFLREEIASAGDFEEIVGESNALLYVLSKVREVAPTDSTVLIQGETGVGKELVAQAIHKASDRSEKPFIQVNCAAIPPTLVESEFFGHEAGAYTDARRQRRGRFELANGGTILLDEICEIPVETQARLLRVLQEGRFERVGGSETLDVDVRVIASTNRNIEEEVAAGRFRADLYYRLNVYPLTVPPLRSRREDIPLLVHYHVPRLAARTGKVVEEITPRVMEQLQVYSWPGNVRELMNILEQAVITSTDRVLRLPENFGSGKAVEENAAATFPDGRHSLEEVERMYITRVLEETGGRVEGPGGAAEILAIKPSTLRSKLQKLGLSLKQFR